MSLHKGFTWPLYIVTVASLALLLGLGPAYAAVDESRVREAQTILSALQYDPGPIDGILGVRTRGAILQFQRDHGLELTRSPDAATMKWLRNMRETSADEPAPRPSPPPQPNQRTADTPGPDLGGGREVIRQRLPIPPIAAPSRKDLLIPSDKLEPPVSEVEQGPVPVEVQPERRSFAIDDVEDTQVRGADIARQDTELGRDITPAPSPQAPLTDRKGLLLLFAIGIAMTGLVAIAVLRRGGLRRRRRKTAKSPRRAADRKDDAWLPVGETPDNTMRFEDETDPSLPNGETTVSDTNETITLQIQREPSPETMPHDEERSRLGSEDETKILTSVAQPEANTEQAVLDLVPETGPAMQSDAGSPELEPQEDDESDEDPLAEINIKLAFEQYEQAEELIKEAIEKYPHRHEYVLRLLEVYHAMREPLAFEYYAKMLQRTAGTNSPLLERAIVWWRDLCPDRELFGDTQKEQAAYELARHESRGF